MIWIASAVIQKGNICASGKIGAFLERAVRQSSHTLSKIFNCPEITQMVAERFLWLPFMTVSARSRHIQESPVLFGD